MSKVPYTISNLYLLEIADEIQMLERRENLRFPASKGSSQEAQELSHVSN
jgi:hypothetical protein